jgi:DNA-binding Lrp family transcriptional regulator
LVRAYILIEMVAGHSRKLAASLRGSDSVTDVDRVTGPYDVIAVLEGADINAVSDVVTNDIHSLEGVVRTTTCVCLE